MGARLAGALNGDELDAHLARRGVDARPATRDDLELAFAMLRDAMRVYVADAFGAWDDARQYALFAPSFDLRTHRVLTANGAPAGLLQVEAYVDRIHLARLLLRPEAQGRGLGGRVVRALLEWAHARRLPVALTVLRSKPRARAFYERHGFRTVGETSTHLHLEAEPSAEAESSLAKRPGCA